MVVFENGGQLDTRYAQFYRNAVQQRIADTHSYEQYWSKLEPHLVGKKVVYVSPDGAYNQINLNTSKSQGVLSLITRHFTWKFKGPHRPKSEKANSNKEECYARRLSRLWQR